MTVAEDNPTFRDMCDTIYAAMRCIWPRLKIDPERDLFEYSPRGELVEVFLAYDRAVQVLKMFAEADKPTPLDDPACLL